MASQRAPSNSAVIAMMVTVSGVESSAPGAPRIRPQKPMEISTSSGSMFSSSPCSLGISTLSIRKTPTPSATRISAGRATSSNWASAINAGKIAPAKAPMIGTKAARNTRKATNSAAFSPITVISPKATTAISRALKVCSRTYCSTAKRIEVNTR